MRTLFFYAQDSRGLGHINRTLAIVRPLLARYQDCVAYIATRSPIGATFTLPERCDYIKLPSRLTPATAVETPEEEEEARERFRRIRGRLLREAALALAPDLVVVDHEPLGSAGEFRDGLFALRAARPATRFVCGLRDIMDDADRIREKWRALGIYDAFEQLYDGIAVYGSPALYDVAEAYAIPAAVRPKLHYCGYVVREEPPADRAAVRREYGLPGDAPLVVATVGSGSDGYPVLEAAREAIERLRRRFPGLLAVLVTGPFMPADQQAALRTGAPAHCRVLASADVGRLMAAADAIVSMGGYNSVCEALVAGRPLVIVPRATHKVEQRIRAETLAAHGLARWVHPAELGLGRLEEALAGALDGDREAHARRVRDILPAFDGGERLIAWLSNWLEEEQG